MESMRSLDTSLPGASPSKTQIAEPAEQLLNAFKAAALSVTKLYKTAADDKGRAKAEGYQAALDELLAFLDKEDIGLSDGEGWRVRAWATERLDGRDAGSQSMESDDESGEKADRSLSPEIHRSQSATRLPCSTGAPSTASPARMGSQGPPTINISTATPIPIATDSTTAPPQGIFTFRSSHTYPQDPDLTLSDLDLSDGTRAQTRDDSVTSQASNPPVNFTRPPRANTRHNNHSGRSNARASNTLSRSSDKKRKINMADFFDISNSSHGKDGFGGGGKRGRFV